MLQRQLLRKAIDSRIDKPDAFAFASDRDDSQLADARGIDHRLRMFVIGGDDRRAAIDDQIREKPQLRCEIVLDSRMIIHVVTRQIGESTRADAHPVEAVLVETMRRRLERQMGHALARDLVE